MAKWFSDIKKVVGVVSKRVGITTLGFTLLGGVSASAEVIPHVKSNPVLSNRPTKRLVLQPNASGAKTGKSIIRCGHYSHSSHVSHLSHYSHYSHYSSY